jgi:hypothetical protein
MKKDSLLTDELLKEFLAKGGKVTRVERGMRSEEMIPLSIKRRNIMAKLKAKAEDL